MTQERAISPELERKIRERIEEYERQISYYAKHRAHRSAGEAQLEKKSLEWVLKEAGVKK